jgi:trehalose 6-phosphate phosphatase
MAQGAFTDNVRARHNIERCRRAQYGARGMSLIAATQQNSGWALFLDVDGTLVEFAQTPQEARVPEHVKRLLNAICVRLDGALALVSGRRIADLDSLFSPYRFCAAGVHGCETRDSSGCLVSRPKIEMTGFEFARGILEQLIERHPALLLEDKKLGIALHFRRAPHLHVLARTTMKSIVDVLGPGFALLTGHCVYEIRPSAWTKATALAGFMARPPFHGRMPVFVGDDITDEDAFALVNDYEGISVRVGGNAPTLARYSLASVADAIDWLSTIPPVTPPSRVRAEEPECGGDRSSA